MADVTGLIEKLKTGDVLGGSLARTTLMSMGEPAVRPLIEAVRLDYQNSKLRHSAETILVRIGNPAVEGLTEALQDDSPDVRKFAEMVLGYIRGVHGPKEE